MSTKRILAITSTPRPHKLSHTGVLFDALRDHILELRQNWEFEFVKLTDLEVNTCDGNGRCFRRGDCIFKDDAERLIDSMLEADGIIMISPNYCANVNSIMMQFVERTTRLSHRRLLKGKGGLAITTSASPFDSDHAAVYLRRLLGSYGASVVDPLNLGSPLIVRDFGDNDHGQLMRARAESFIQAVEDPEGMMPEEEFGVDIRQQLRENPEYAKRLFRSDDRFFQARERGSASQREETHATN